jgi:hypothetical protein
MVRKMVSRTHVDHMLRYTDKNLKVYTDFMHVDKVMFLVSIVDLLSLTLQCTVENESQHVLGLELQGHLAILRSRDFNPHIVYVDPHFEE